MKKILLLALPVLFLLSCKKEGNSSYVKTISSGSKWGLQIGSSYADVYSRLQQLGAEKNIESVAIVRQQYFDNPEGLKDRLVFYNAITIMNKTGIEHRAFVEFKSDKITSIYAGGSLPDEVDKWPMDVPDAAAFHKGDSVSGMYAKLQAIFQLPTYSSNYQIVLPDKTLKKPFDPEMVNYEEWDFGFFESVKVAVTGRSSVRLSFKNGKLNKIKHTYDEYDIVN